MMMLPAFFALVNPASTRANPACMNMTSAPARRSHTASTAMPTSAIEASWAKAPPVRGPKTNRATSAVAVMVLRFMECLPNGVLS